MDKKIEEARTFLEIIGMPKAQQSDLCCYVILAMAGIKPNTPWSQTTNEWIGIHDIIQFVNKFYKINYAENSRETVRKQALHRFRTAAWETEVWIAEMPEHMIHLNGNRFMGPRQ